MDFNPGSPERYAKFRKLFEAQNLLGDLVNDILDYHKDKMKVRLDDQYELSLIVAAALGKGLKTFQAIHLLCRCGFGEDALVLLRSNINLLINIGYILSDDRTKVERAKNFIAYSHKALIKYLKEVHQVDGFHPPLEMSQEEIDKRSKIWDRTRIAQRAEAVSTMHYQDGYRFYSSIEHSDVSALGEYFDDWNEAGPVIGSGPNDKRIDIALIHSFGIMADLLMFVCKYWEIDRPDIFEKLGKTWSELGKFEENAPR